MKCKNCGRDILEVCVLGSKKRNYDHKKFSGFYKERLCEKAEPEKECEQKQ